MTKTSTKPKAKRTPRKTKKVAVRTAIHVLLDRSGSMGPARESTCRGFNEFLDEQRKTEGGFLALTQFDNAFEPNYGLTSLAKVPYLDYSTYQPRGGTALYDSIAKSIAEFETAVQADEEGFDQVLFVIITDGAENASQEYGRFNDGKSRIFNLIKQYSDVKQWQFVYIGASADAYQEGSSIGVANTVRTGRGAQGMSSAFMSVSTATSAYRGSGKRMAAGDTYFSDEEKSAMASTVDKEG